MQGPRPPHRARTLCGRVLSDRTQFTVLKVQSGCLDGQCMLRVKDEIGKMVY